MKLVSFNFNTNINVKIDNEVVSDSIKSINFGLAAAENELARSPNLLTDGFLDQQGYMDKIVKGYHFLICGPKGSGKSAIASKIMLSKDKLGINARMEKLDNLRYERFDGITPHNTASEHRDIESWEFILSVYLIEMFGNDPNYRNARKDRLNVLINGLKELGVLPAKDIAETVTKLTKKELTLSFKVVQSKTTTETVPDFEKMKTNVMAEVYQVKLSQKHMLIIDDLDSILTKRVKQYQVLGALLHAANDINTKLLNNKISAKIVILCRSDLMFKISDPNLTKIVVDSGITLDWYQDIKDIKNTNLNKLVDLRASLALKRDVSLFSEFFPPKYKDRDTEKALFNYTRHLPRDLIELLNLIKDSTQYTVNENSIANGLKQYANEYFYREIRDDLYGLVKTEDVDEFLDILGLLGLQEFSYATLRDFISRKGKELDYNEILVGLYNCGGIGNVMQKEDGKKLYTFKYRNPHSNFNPDKTIIIHSALWEALKTMHA